MSVGLLVFIFVFFFVSICTELCMCLGRDEYSNTA